MIRMIRSVVSILLVVYVVLSFFLPIEMEDIWWHLATGRWMVTHKAVPHEDVFPPVTGAVRPWVFTQWLGSLILYGVYHIGGLWGLKIFRSLLFIVIAGIFLLYGRRRLPFSWLMALTFLMVVALKTRFVIRPCIMNMIFIQLFLICLLAYQRTGRRRFLAFLPLMGIFWSEINLGSFIYGNLLILIFFLAEIPTFLDRKRLLADKATCETNRRRLEDYSLCLGGYLFSFFVSPYGLDGFLYPFKVVLLPKFIHFYQFNSVIYEMTSPFISFSWRRHGVLLLLTGLDIAALVMMKKYHQGVMRAQGAPGCRSADMQTTVSQKSDCLGAMFTCVLLFIFSLGFINYGMRGVVFFSIVSVYIIARAAEHIALKDRWQTWRLSRFFSACLLFILTLALLYNIIPLARGKIQDRGGIRNNLSVLHYPIGSHRPITFLRKHKIYGPVFHGDPIGGYMIWSAYPDLKPFIDGRQLHFDCFIKYFKVKARPAVFWPKAEGEFGFKIVILDSSRQDHTRLVQHLLSLPDWQLIFMDGPYVILVKKGAFDLPGDIEHWEQRLRLMTFDTEDMAQARELVAGFKPPGFWARWWNPPPSYVELIEEGLTLYDLGFKAAGMHRLVRAFKVYPCKYTARSLQVALKKFEQDTPQP